MIKKVIVLAVSTCTLLAESNVIDLEPISVTATGIEESVLEQALSISTKEEQEVKLDQVIFQKDLLNSLSGVRIEQTGSVIGHMTSIRMPINTNAYYLFMQDGIPVQSSGFFNHNGLAYTTFQSASSVEVLKGAGTALYGSDAVAATINVESLKAPSKNKELIIKGMGGSDGYASGSLEMSDTIDKDSGYRASIGYMYNDGWRDHTETDRFEANIRYDQTLDSDNDLKVLFNMSHTDAEQADSFNDYGNIRNGSEAASDDPAYFTALESTDVRREFDYARFSVEWTNYSYNDLEISLTPYIRYNRNQYIATWEPNLPSNDNKIKTFGLLQKNTYDASWGLFILGFDAEYTESSLEYNQDFDITTTGWGGATYTQGAIYDYDVEYMAVAPYMHTRVDLSDQFKLTAGLRYDYNHFDYDNNLADNSTDSSGKYFRRADRTDDFSHVSPKLSLSYQPTNDTNIYLRYANGFRIPQATRLYSMKSGYENVDLDPETSNTYELGIKKYFSEKSYVELITYYMTIDDTITRYTNNVTSDYYYDNGDTTIHKGIEFSTRIQATKDIATKIAYSYSRHEYDNDDNYGDSELSQAPNHLANVRLIYTPSQVKGLRLMGEWQYTGSYWMDDDHSNKYDGYDIFNLKADYAYDDKVRIFAKVTNLTDERYAVSARYAYGKSDYTPGDPRQFYAGLEYRW